MSDLADRPRAADEEGGDLERERAYEHWMIARLSARAAELEAVLREVEWIPVLHETLGLYPYHPASKGIKQMCPSCRRLQPHPHQPDCRLARLLSPLPEEPK